MEREIPEREPKLYALVACLDYWETSKFKPHVIVDTGLTMQVPGRLFA
jgi:hypothetical protein